MRHILLLCSLFFTLVGCNSLAPEERWSQPTPIVPKKHVLLLEYTGQRCVNCPAAAQLIADLQSRPSGDHIISVAIHGGQLAENSERNALGLANGLPNRPLCKDGQVPALMELVCLCPPRGAEV